MENENDYDFEWTEADAEAYAENQEDLARRDRNGWSDIHHGARMLANERENS